MRRHEITNRKQKNIILILETAAERGWDGEGKTVQFDSTVFHTASLAVCQLVGKAMQTKAPQMKERFAKGPGADRDWDALIDHLLDQSSISECDGH